MKIISWSLIHFYLFLRNKKHIHNHHHHHHQLSWIVFNDLISNKLKKQKSEKNFFFLTKPRKKIQKIIKSTTTTTIIINEWKLFFFTFVQQFNFQFNSGKEKFLKFNSMLILFPTGTHTQCFNLMSLCMYIYYEI